MSRSIAKNTTYITVASVLQKVISFGYFTLIARHIGAADTGKYFFALSFTTVFVVFVDLGLTSVLVRESAKANEKIQDYLSVILSMKLVLGVLSYIAAAYVIHILGYQIETQQLVFLSAVTMLFDSFNLSMYGVLRAIGDLRYESRGIIASQLLTLIMGIFFLYHGYPLIFLILAFTVPSACNSIYAAIIVVKKFHIRIRPKWNSILFRRIMAIVLPFAFAAVFSRIYSYADSILLSKLAGDTAVGWYSIPYKITYAFQFIPLALVAVLYARFSEFYVHQPDRLAHTFEWGMKYLLLIAFPVAVGVSVLAKPIVTILYTSAYTPSIVPLQILMASLVLSFLSFPIGAFLNACDRQKTQTFIVGIVMVVNIIVNLLLIPRYGVVGAAIAALVGSTLLTVLGYLVARHITRISHSFLFISLIQITFSAGVMGIIVWFTNQYIHLVPAILIGMIVYPLMLFITRAITKIQLKEAFALLKSS